MRPPILLLCAFVAAVVSGLTAPRLAAAVSPEESVREFAVSADFNGDSWPDVLIADKPTGVVRVSLGTPGGGFAPLRTWSVQNRITGLALGHLFSPTRLDALVLDPDRGRLVALHLSGASAGETEAYDTTGVGPSRATFARFGVGAPAGLEDVVAATVLDSAPTPDRIEVLRNTGATLKPLDQHVVSPAGQGLLQAFPLWSSRGSANVLVGWVSGKGTGPVTVQVHDVSDGVLKPTSPDAQIEIKSTAPVRTGFFGNPLQTRLVTVFGGSMTSIRLDGTPLKFEMGVPDAAPNFSPQTVAFSTPVAGVSVAPGSGANPDRLVIRFEGSPGSVGLYDYVPGKAPVLVRELDAAGGVPTATVPLPDGSLLVLSAASAGQPSRSMVSHDSSGKVLGTTVLPVPTALTGRSTVAYYNGAPMADPSARLVGVVSVGDWTRGLPTNSPLPGVVTAVREVFQGSSVGLGSAVATVLGAPPLGATHVLGSQMADDISFFSFRGGSGSVLDTLAILPPGGSFEAATEVEITSAENIRRAALGLAATQTLQYRFDTAAGPGTWMPYDPNHPPVLVQSGVLRTFGQTAGGQRSPIRSAVFQISPAVGRTLDSDLDGVPDFVEQANGLDPRSGVDADGDGDSDLNEIAAGTNPADASDFMARDADGRRLTGLNSPSYSIQTVVVGLDGTGGSVAVRAADTNVEIAVHAPDGSPLSAGRTKLMGNVSIATIGRVPTEGSRRFVSVRTPQFFGLTKAANTNNPPPGREQATLVETPEVGSVLPTLEFAGGDVIPAAAQWRTLLRSSIGPSDGVFLLSGGGTTTIPAGATAAQVKARLDAANGGAGWFNSGPAIVTGGFPRFVVQVNAPSGTGTASMTTVSALQPPSQVQIGQRQRAGSGMPLIFEILITPAPRLVRAANSLPETLVTLLVELKLERLLGEGPLTLLSGRPGDELRSALTDRDLEALEAGSLPGVGAHRFSDIFRPIHEAVVNSPTGPMNSLLKAMGDIYTVSSRRQPTNGPALTEDQIKNVLMTGTTTGLSAAMELPIDSTRTFLRSGTVSAEVATLVSAATLAEARSAVDSLLALPQRRPESVVTLVLNSFGLFEQPAVPPLTPAVAYHLLNSAGSPYAFNAAFEFRPGLAIRVAGYTDVQPLDGSASKAIEVQSITLLGLPVELGVEMNLAPVFDAVGPQSVEERKPWTLTLKATDLNVPAQTLSYKLLSGPAGVGVNATTGEVTWTPGEAEGGRTFDLVFEVADAGTPPLTAQTTVRLAVIKVNHPPTLAPIADMTIPERIPWSMQAIGTDGDLPIQTLAYSLTVHPPGMTVNATTGVVQWTPTEEQGQGTYPVTVQVTEPLGLTAERSFRITVTEVNREPEWAALPDAILVPGKSLTLTLLAADPDLPANPLSYRLVRGPSNLVVTPQGQLTWTPVRAQAPSANRIEVAVSDGTLSVTNGFTAEVVDLVTLVNGVVALNTVGSLPPVQFSIEHSKDDWLVFYSLDGTEPTALSSAYLEPQQLETSSTVWPILFKPDLSASVLGLPVRVNVWQEQSLTVIGGEGLVHQGAGVAIAGTASSGLPVTLEVVSGPGRLENGLLVPQGGGTVRLRAAQAGNDTWAPASMELERTVAPAVQTVTWTPVQAATFGDAPLTLQASASSGLPVTFSVLSGPGTVSGATLTLIGAGTIAVRATPPGSADFQSATAETTVAVSKASQSLTFAALANRAFTTGGIPLEATASSGLAVTYRIVSGAATVSGAELRLTGVGSVAVAAEQAGTANYLPAPGWTNSFTVSPGEQTITFQPIGDMVLGSGPVALVATSSAGLPVTFSVLSGPATVSGTSLTLLDGGAVTVRALNPGSPLWMTAQVDQTFQIRSPTTLNLTVVQLVGAPLALDVEAAEGAAVVLETTTDLRSWSEVQRLTGQGPGKQMRVTVTPDPNTRARFWRARVL